MDRASPDALRTLELHLAATTAHSPTPEDAAARPLARRRHTTRASGFVDRVEMKLGLIDYQRSVLEPLVAARTAVLGAGAAGAPRFLVRVDEFPHFSSRDEPTVYGTEFSRRFHRTLADAGIPYLMAIVPEPALAALDPNGTLTTRLDDSEIALLEEMRRDRVTFALHGWTHRSRSATPRRRSELDGLGQAELEQLLNTALAILAELDITPKAFVPPFNRFDRSQYPELASRFDVVCGGPESVSRMGYGVTPSWQGDAVYMPAYPPFYASASEVIPAARAAIEQQVGVWIPIVLHTGWESSDDFKSLGELGRLIAPHTADWSEFLAIVAELRNGGADVRPSVLKAG
jgi:Uncharacterized protein conserved in bacteria (DUF2334)